MKLIEIEEAQRRFSDLINEVEKGREFVLTRGGKPAAKLVRMSAQIDPEKIAIRRNVDGT